MGGMRVYPAATSEAPMLLLAHGAGAGEEHPWMRRIAAGMASRGVGTVTFNFPYREAGRKVPDRAPVLEAALQSAWAAMVRDAPRARIHVVGGKSMGGRMASQLAARQGFTPPPVGLVFFGYPLHPPGKPAERRDRHLPLMVQPALFIHGTRDPFGTPDEMHELTSALSTSTLAIIDGGDHSLVAPKRDDPAGGSVERALNVAATWILALPPRA